MPLAPLYSRISIRLTSPHMHDGRGRLKGSHLVRDTQWLLDGHNKDARNHNKPFGDFYKGSYDGDYGPYTASAVRQAKYFLGYPEKYVNEECGPVIQAYLRGQKKIPLSYEVRRKSRLSKAKQAETIREKAFAKAVTKIGVHESPANSNNVEFSRWYGIIGSWCAMFVTWCYVSVGGKRLARSKRYAYVPYIVDDARAGRNGMHLTANPVRGDIVCFRFPGNSVPDHTGLFDRWINRNAGEFATVEGNTGNTSWDNGGEVMRRTRYKSQVAAFVRVVEP